MQSNPIVERQLQAEAEHRERENFRYPFRIICVFENKENSDFPIIRDVRDFCLLNHITMVSRQYDVDQYPEDMDLRRLPAFYISLKGYVQETHYYDVDPVYKIQLYMWAYQDEQRERERAKIRRQEQWTNFVEGLQSFFSLERFKRRPALDPELSLSHARDFNSTEGTPSGEQCTQRQTPRRASQPGQESTGQGEVPATHQG